MSLADKVGGLGPQQVSGEESDSDYENDEIRPRGLTGLQNLGNTCYLNSAIQSLSNCPPLTDYFLNCGPLVRPEKAPKLSVSYLKLMREIWHRQRPSYVVPSGVVSGIKAVHPMFRGYAQQDAQEFLRCLMDQLHEELKVAIYEDDDGNSDEASGEDTNNANNADEMLDDDAGYQHDRASPESTQQVSPLDSPRRSSFDSASSRSSELNYETCDSGLSSGRSGHGDQELSGDSDCDIDTLKQEEGERKCNVGALVEGNQGVAGGKEVRDASRQNQVEKCREPRERVMSGGDARNLKGRERVMSGGDAGSAVNTRDGEVQTVSRPRRESSNHSLPPVKKPPKSVKHDSIISQTFDGRILSSVRCLNCESVSTTQETFQDLSLPILSQDHLHMLHSAHHQAGLSGGMDASQSQGWFSWMYGWMRSWFTGPTVTLQDCLSAFFSADELKGDNMYSCEKCKKLRNGLKYARVMELPEILSVHLKRFRHEFYSSKISTYVSFPLKGLDMQPYLDKSCKNGVRHYDLVAIICHHGTAGGGHYTAYCLNHCNDKWYQFDDHYVTEVDVNQVLNCEAYVLFYRKTNKKMESLRRQVAEIDQRDSSILKFHLSKPWLSRFQTFAEPGPITNYDFLCRHGGVPPAKVPLCDDLIVEVQQSTWEVLHQQFGGGPVCNHLYACKTCHIEMERLRQRQCREMDTFIQLNNEFRDDDDLSAAVYAISMSWFKEWEAFVREKTQVPPGPIDNLRIVVQKNGVPTLRSTSDHGQVSSDMWLFLHGIYGGGPEVLIRAGAPVPASSQSQMSATSSSSTATPVNSSTSVSSSTSSVSATPQHVEVTVAAPREENSSTEATVAHSADLKSKDSTPTPVTTEQNKMETSPVPVVDDSKSSPVTSPVPVAAKSNEVTTPPVKSFSSDSKSADSTADVETPSPSTASREPAEAVKSQTMESLSDIYRVQSSMPHLHSRSVNSTSSTNHMSDISSSDGASRPQVHKRTSTPSTGENKRLAVDELTAGGEGLHSDSAVPQDKNVTIVATLGVDRCQGDVELGETTGDNVSCDKISDSCLEKDVVVSETGDKSKDSAISCGEMSEKDNQSL